MDNTLNAPGTEKLPGENRYVVSPEALSEAVDAALRGGQQLTLLGRTSNDAAGRFIVEVSAATNDVTCPHDFKGNLGDAEEPSEGVFAVATQSLIETAERSKQMGLAMRLLGRAEGDGRDTVRAQFFRQPAPANEFPQDFWLNRLASAPNLSAALMEVVERRT